MRVLDGETELGGMDYLEEIPRGTTGVLWRNLISATETTSRVTRRSCRRKVGPVNHVDVDYLDEDHCRRRRIRKRAGLVDWLVNRI